MRVVLVDLAAKYIHSGLAVRYLKNACISSFPKTVIIEETINRPLDKIVEIILRENPEVVGFSCYIWNISVALDIADTLKKILPDVKIILGGPEVSYTPEDVLNNNLAVDYIICGEGEVALPLLLQSIQNKDGKNIKGVAWRGNFSNETAKAVEELDDIPNPYLKTTRDDLENKIVYYECSRGCPYRCSYCLSGLAGAIRFLPIARVKRELEDLAVNKKVKQIKFVDRTFNHNKEYAYEVIEFLKNLDCDTNFHFEIRADIIDPSFLELIKDAKQGKFQFEIGIQTTNQKTLESVNRKHNWPEIVKNTQIIKSYNNIHQHLDLIAGLPFENLESFKKSFEDVYSLKPDMLQLGFLKLLKGSAIWLDRDKFNYKYTSYPPYEVLSNDYMSYDDLIELKGVEHVLEIFYNSGDFKYTLDFITAENSYAFYYFLSKFFKENELDKRNHSLYNQFLLLHSFFEQEYNDELPVLKELLKLDYLVHFTHRKLPDFLNHIEIDNYRQTAKMLLNNEVLRNQLTDSLKSRSNRELLKHTHFEVFPLNIPLLIASKKVQWQKSLLLFDYSEQSQNYFHKKAFFYGATEFLN